MTSVPHDRWLGAFRLEPDTKLTPHQADDLIARLTQSPHRWVLRARTRSRASVYMTLDVTNFNTMDTLRRILTSDWWSPVELGIEPGVDESWGSGPSYALRNTEDPPVLLTLEPVQQGARPRSNRSVAYLPYRLVGAADNLDLSRYQLFAGACPESELPHCVIHSLRLAGIPEEDLVKLDWKFIGKTTHLSKKVFENIAQSLGRCLQITPLNEVNDHVVRGKKSRCLYNKGAPGEVIKLACVHSHMFIDEKTNITKYYLRNMAYCRELARARGLDEKEALKWKRNPMKPNGSFLPCGGICGGQTTESSKVFLSSLDVMRYLFFEHEGEPVIEHDLSGSFTKQRTAHSKTFYLTDHIVNKSQQPFRVNVKLAKGEDEASKPTDRVFACDIEADVSGPVHVAMLCAAVEIPGNQSEDRPLEDLFGQESPVAGLGVGKECLLRMFTDLANRVLKNHPHRIALIQQGEESSQDQQNPDAAGDEVVEEKDHEEEENEGDDADDSREEIAAEEQQSGRVQPVFATCYFHNLRYDSKHLINQFRTRKIVQKANTLYSLTFFCHGVHFVCMDSLKVIDLPLASFQSKLKLPACFNKRDDLIAYSYHRLAHTEEEDYDDFACTVEEYAAANDNLFTDLERGAFIQGLVDVMSAEPELFQYQPSESDDVVRFNPNYLYQYYLFWDCRVLAAGLVAMERAINSIPGIENRVQVIGKMTLPSIAKTLFWQEGCFWPDGTVRAQDDRKQQTCYGFTGRLRSWSQRAIAGGRVMPGLKCPWGMVDGEFQYLDFCSLYPTSVVRICRKYGGFPAGRCRLLSPSQLNADFLLDSKQVFNFLVRIKVTAVRKEQKCGIPALSYQDPSSGNRPYVNAMPDGVEFFETYVAKVGLEDAIEIHDIEFEVLEGVYYPASGPVATSYGEVVSSLYDRRAVVKKTAEGESIKRLLNSGAYGVFIMKQSETEYKFMPFKSLHTYIYNEWHRVSKYSKYGKQWMVELFANDSSAMPVMWGVMVLETSKRIMNEVLNCLSTLDAIAYYTDTDSLTVSNTVVPALAAEYERRYGARLLGDQLGQMNSDFSLNDDKGKPIPEDHVVSEGFACAGKKSYLHLLRGTTPDGGVHLGYKTSAKGITKVGLEAKAKAMCPPQFDDQPKHVQVREGLRALFTKISQKGDAGVRVNLFPPRSKKRKFTYTSDSVSTNSDAAFVRVMKNTRKDFGE